MIPHMISCATAAEHVAGMIRAIPTLAIEWKKLPKSDQQALLTNWEQAFHNPPSKAATEIIITIASHSQLSHPWNELTPDLHQSISASIQSIARNILLQDLLPSSITSPSSPES